ncbi:MAG: helix-turn-helix domain-containing protein [Prevotellaceae bacterium]|jgi:AraC-like DNA-binding protein|nr:helix-turn-helix domain-containing protein [Prevotellaceae bacterium]
MKENQKQITTTNYVENNSVYVECIEKTKKGDINIPELSQIRLFFIQKGSCSFFSANHVDVLLESGRLVLLPPRNKCIIKVKNNIQIMVIYLTVDLNFCHDFPFEALTEVENESKDIIQMDEHFSLKTNKIISDYLKFMKMCLANGMKSAEFFQMKQRELLYYFGKCYNKEELYRFFKPILTSDIAFSKKVYRICERVSGVGAMAKEMNYSLSGFKKRFKRVFGLSAYKWLCQEKSKKLFHEITCSRKTFTQLSYDFGFSSPAHMNNFCRKMFGDTPGGLRTKKILQQSN